MPLKTKIAYEDDGPESLHMLFLLYFFYVFSPELIRQDMMLRKKSDDLF